TLWNPQLSPDGKRVAVDRTVNGNRDIWLIDATRGVLTRITSGAASEGLPIWSPDGNRIVFFSNRKGINNLYQKLMKGAAVEDPLLESSQNKTPTDWSADGQFILYTDTGPATGLDVWALPLFGDHKPFPVVNSSFDERDGQFSPNGRWIAYGSNESQRL